VEETRRKFDPEFKEGAVRIVGETGKPIAEVAWELGINPGTLGNWVAQDRQAREDGEAPLSDLSVRSCIGYAGRMHSL
jgi:transposase